MTWNKDVYTNPEDFGLTIVTSVDWDDEPYHFDMTVVWKDSEGYYYAASDSGCSCPSPFETYTTLASLGDPMTLHEVIKFLTDKMPDYSHHYNSERVAIFGKNSLANGIESLLKDNG